MDNQPEWKRTKESTVVINGQEWTIRGGEASYATIISLAAVRGSYPSVTYQKGGGEKREGVLAPGESVVLGERTVFNVVTTDSA